jgi:hypothetical protein
MSLGKRFLISLPGAVIFAAVAMAQVAPNTLFQLDGNAASTPLSCSYGPCDYWDLLNGTGNNLSGGGIGAGSSAGNSTVRTFINGTLVTNVYSRGSKDTIDFPANHFAINGSPNKDTINAGYAAAYSSNGDFLVMFGGDRASPNGSSFIGIWFLQQSVRAGSTGNFIGAHTDHDVFVISNFAGGGSTSEIQVLEWDHAGCGNIKSAVKNPADGACSDTNLRLLKDATTVCGSSAYCAVANAASTVTTWEGTLASPLFFEGGVNITQAFKTAGISQLPCFTSFMEETRASFSTSAELKDFLVGGFPVCGLSLTKACGTATITADGTQVNYPVNGVVTNTGAGSLYNVSVFDTPQGGTAKAIVVSNNVSASPNFNTSTLGAGETGIWGDSTTSSGTSASDSAIAQGGLSSSTTPNGSSTQSNTVTSDPASKTCTFTASTTLGVTKNCTTSLQVANGVVDVLVNFSGTVYNNGPSKVTGVALKDTPTNGASATINVGDLGPCNPAAFDANGNCTTAGAFKAYSSSYTPTNIDTVINGVGGPGTGPGRYSWTDVVTITDATATVGTLNKLTSGPFAGSYGGDTASCPICQGSGECAP